MQTPSHLIITAALRHPLRRQSLPISTWGLLIGSVVPDLPLVFLSLTYWQYYRINEISVPAPTIIDYLGLELFYNDPVWITAHNAPHSLIVGGLLLALGYWLYQRGRRTFLFWLAASMMLHTTIDIFTHTFDGPLFLFPLNWTYRFQSPISYWDTDYGATYFLVFEYALDALLLVLLGRKYLQHRRNRQHATSTQP